MKTNYLNTFIKKTSIVALALASFTAVAQDEETTETKKFNLTGSVDTYFRTNLTSRNRPGIAPATSFANGTGFSIGMVNTIFSYQASENVGFVADLVFGPRGADAVLNSTGSANIVNQAYVYWNVSDAVTLTAGNFNTYLGYEVISPTGNFNYSTSYMFSNGPFSHTGLKADFAIDDNWSAMLAVMNPTDYTETNPFDTYILGAQLGYSNDSGSAYLNFRYGNEDEPGAVGPTFQADLTTGWDISEDFYLGVNGTYLSTEAQEVEGEDKADAKGFYGIALYPQFKTSDSFTVGLRGEYFSMFNGALLTDGKFPVGVDENNDGSVIATTLTGSWTKGALTLKPELRFDVMSEDTIGVFVDQDGESTDSLASFVLGAVYAF